MVREIKGIEGIIEGVSYAWDRGMAWHSCEVAGFWTSAHQNGQIMTSPPPYLADKLEVWEMSVVVRWQNVTSWNPPLRRKSGGGCR